jgi:hypothetical protein
MTAKSIESVWITSAETKTSAYVMQRGSRIFVVSTCCNGEIHRKMARKAATCVYYCGRCSKALLIQPQHEPVCSWTITEFNDSKTVIKGWINYWTDIPEDDMKVTVTWGKNDW